MEAIMEGEKAAQALPESMDVSDLNGRRLQ
jgi:hypothetical protein